MTVHAKIAAWIYLLGGLAGVALSVAAFLLYAGVGTMAVMEDGSVGGGLMGWGFAIGFGAVLAALSLPSAMAGYGLLRRRPWARPLGIGLAVLNLFFPPLGTLFGIYALVGLLDSTSEPVRTPRITKQGRRALSRSR